MSKYSGPRHPARHLSSNPSSKSANDLGGGHGVDIGCNGTGHAKVTNDVPRHRRVTSASERNLRRLLREGQMLQKQSRDESIPEPSDGMDEIQRRTWQTQWADALKKVQSLRLSGAGAQSERWAGVATDIYRPKSLTTPDTTQPSNARTSLVAPPSSMDRWNYYPGPSVNRDRPPSQLENTIPENGNVVNNSLLGGAMSNREGKLRTTTGDLLKGRGSKSMTTFGKVHPPLDATQSIICDDNMVAQQEGRPSTNFSPTPSLDQFRDELQRPESYSALASRVQRTQSHRYGRTWGQKPEAYHPSDSNSSSAYQSAAVLKPILKKAISMREGGAHQEAVLEMARAYTDTVCGVPKTLECASCGRNLGIIVQGNPGVDIAFCQACRPSPMQWKREWKKPISDDAAGSRKKKNVITQFCRKLLGLDKKSSENFS